MSDIIFGTDGWRAGIAEEYTFDNVRRCTQGFADYIRETYPGEVSRGVVIGGDKRFLSENFAAAARRRSTWPQAAVTYFASRC